MVVVWAMKCAVKTCSDCTVYDATKPDRRLLRDRNILSFTVDAHELLLPRMPNIRS